LSKIIEKLLNTLKKLSNSIAEDTSPTLSWKHSKKEKTSKISKNLQHKPIETQTSLKNKPNLISKMNKIKKKLKGKIYSTKHPKTSILLMV
jgi:hypothetical protein